MKFSDTKKRIPKPFEQISALQSLIPPKLRPLPQHLPCEIDSPQSAMIIEDAIFQNAIFHEAIVEEDDVAKLAVHHPRALPKDNRSTGARMGNLRSLAEENLLADES